MGAFSNKPYGSATKIMYELHNQTKVAMADEAMRFQSEMQIGTTRVEIGVSGEDFSGKAVTTLKERLEHVCDTYNNHVQHDMHEVLTYRKQLFE